MLECVLLLCQGNLKHAFNCLVRCEIALGAIQPNPCGMEKQITPVPPLILSV